MVNEIGGNLLLGLLAGLLASLLTSTIYFVLFKKELQSSQSKTYMVVNYGMVLCTLLLTFSFAWHLHSWRDSMDTLEPIEKISLVVNTIEKIPLVNKLVTTPLNPPLELNLCEDEWYPNCAYDN